MKSWKDDPRAKINPLFNENRLKLGVFGLNSGHQIMTTAPDRYVADWARCDSCGHLIDEYGIETMVSLMGWMGNPELEPFTWGAALCGRYAHPAFISTFHMQLMHPTFVAKAAATIDLVSGGRFGMNVVAGFNPATFEAFGGDLPKHETRYAQADEFMDLLKRLWTAESHFSFEGQFYNIAKVVSNPRPIQHFPAVMNAGQSGRGRDFACKHADMAFTLLHEDLDEVRAQIKDYKAHARDAFNREVQVWTHGHIVIRETEKEAEDFLNYYAVEHADHEKIKAWVASIGASGGNPDAKMLAKLHKNWAAGAGTRLVGTADQVAEKLSKLADCGLDGMLWNTIEPERLLGQAGRELLPRLEAMGVRKPMRTIAKRAGQSIFRPD